MPASSPASAAITPQYGSWGMRVIAIISRMTSGYDSSRRRCLGRPAATAASTMASITPSPRWRSISPSRT